LRAAAGEAHAPLGLVHGHPKGADHDEDRQLEFGRLEIRLIRTGDNGR